LQRPLVCEETEVSGTQRHLGITETINKKRGRVATLQPARHAKEINCEIYKGKLAEGLVRMPRKPETNNASHAVHTEGWDRVGGCWVRELSGQQLVGGAALRRVQSCTS